MVGGKDLGVGWADPALTSPRAPSTPKGPAGRASILLPAPPSAGRVRRPVSPGPKNQLGNQREHWETLNSRTAGGYLLQGSQAYLWQQVVPTWSHCPPPPSQNTHCFPVYMLSSQLFLLRKARELSLSGRNTSSQQEGGAAESPERGGPLGPSLEKALPSLASDRREEVERASSGAGSARSPVPAFPP